MIEYDPKPVEAIWIVVRLSDEVAPSYAPTAAESRTKKYWSEKEARNLYKRLLGQGIPAKLYKATVNDWIEE